MIRLLALLVIATSALVARPADAQAPLAVALESGTLPLELKAEAGGFVGRFAVENRSGAPVRASVRARPGSSTVPRLPASVGVGFDTGRGETLIAPGQKATVVVRWVVREPSPQHLLGHVMVESDGGETLMVGVRAMRPRSFLADHALALLFLLPLVGIGVLLALHFARYEKLRRLRFVAGAVALAQIGLAALLVRSFDVGLSRYHGGDGFQFVQAGPLLPSLGIQYWVGIDGITLPPLLLAPVALLGAALVAESVSRRLVAFWCWMLALEAAVIGALIALDLALFVAAFAVAALALVLLVGGFSGAGRHGTRVATYFAVSAGALALATFLLAGHSGTTHLLDGTAITRSFSFVELSRVEFLGSGLMSKSSLKLTWALLFVAFAIPLGAVPFHGWLVATLRASPTPLGILVVGTVAPLGVYGFVRFGFGLLPDGTVWAATALGAIGIGGAAWAAIAAIAERDLARFTGYAVALHAGTVLLSLSGLTGIGVEGALAQNAGHALAAAALLAVVGALRDRVGTSDSSALGGIAADAPLFAVLAGVAFAGSMALPGTAAFVGQTMGVVGAIPHQPWLVPGAVIVALAAAAAHAAAYARTFFGEVPERWRQSRELEPHGGRFPDLASGELGALAGAAVLVIALGFAPGLLLRLTDSSALDAAERVSPPGPTEVSSAPTPIHLDSVLALNSDGD